MTSAKQRVVLQDRCVKFKCPGCHIYHVLPVGDTVSGIRPRWTFNGDLSKPTLSPSILARRGHYVSGKEVVGEDRECQWCREDREEGTPSRCVICHSFVTDGYIDFLSDSTHELSGQRVQLSLIEDPNE